MQSSNAWTVLFRLGNEAAITHFEEAFRRTDGHPLEIMVTSGQPRFIPVLMEKVHQNDEPEIKYVDHGDFQSVEYPQSLLGPSGALKIIETSAAFDGSVRLWARFTLEELPKNPAAIRDVIRTWWTDNGNRMRQQRFSEVEAGEYSKLSGPISPVRRNSLPSAKSEERRAASQRGSLAAAPMANMPSKSDGWRWMMGIAAVLLACGGVQATRVYRKKRDDRR